jgi:L-2,4-diaminobutyrate transaminase
MFGSETYDLKPDFMTIAKGLTSAYAPLSGSIISQRVFDVLMQGTDDFGPLAPWLDLLGPSGQRGGGDRDPQSGR